MPMVAWSKLHTYIIIFLEFVVNKPVDDGALADELISQ